MKMQKRRIVSLLLALLMALSTMMSAAATEKTETLDNFTCYRQYAQGQFTDVVDSAWYAETLKQAYELGLVNGSGATTFNPTGNLTVAEALALACRIHSIYYTGDAVFTQGEIWYQVYVDYAISNGIMWDDQFESYTRLATRTEFAQIMACALPKSALTPLNEVYNGQIPDVKPGDAGAVEIYLLYQAGILTGSDKYGTFRPDSNIQRCEVAAIVARMAQTAQRKTFVLQDKPVEVTGVVLSESQKSCAAASAFTLVSTVQPENAADKTVIWSSSDTGVASVDQYGTVTAIKLGTAIITATAANGKCASCTVTVREAELEDIVSDPTEEFKMLRKKNSAGLVELAWTATNNSSKRIKYYTVTAYYYNAVDDPVENDITGLTYQTIRVTGPVEPGGVLILLDVGYCKGCSKVLLGEMKIEFFDGTEVSGWYGWRFPIR